MPLYEYRCTQCGHRFEKIQSFTAAPEKVCPQCGGELIRPLSAPALQFKGAGWYINDYSSKGKSAAAEAGAPAAEGKPAAAAPGSSSPSDSGSGGGAAPAPAAAPAAPAGGTAAGSGSAPTSGSAKAD